MPELFDNPLLVMICAAALSVLFAHAAVSKLADTDLLIHHLAGYGVPVALRHGVGEGVLLVEGLTALLLVSPWRAEGAALAGFLLGSYALLMAFQITRGRVVDCGCGTQALPVSWVLVFRNLVLMLAAWVASHNTPLENLGLFDFSVVAAAVLLAVVIYTAFHQVLIHQALIRQRLNHGGA